jgi:hypothetical protein
MCLNWIFNEAHIGKRFSGAFYIQGSLKHGDT